MLNVIVYPIAAISLDVVLDHHMPDTTPEEQLIIDALTFDGYYLVVLDGPQLSC